MFNFLKGTRKLLNGTEPICLVIGNESCDIDSAVCALSLAFYYQQCQPTEITYRSHFLPILNIPRKEFQLKTEVTYLLQQHQIVADLLTFRDDLPKQKLAASECILVDHHVSPLARQCVQVYDHRPFDTAAALPTSCKLTLEQVGSCATLVAETILMNNTDAPKFGNILQLLHAAIVMDTVNFSTEAARATAKDHSVAEQLEKILEINDSVAERLRIFRELCAAREDVSSLNAHQLLYKDMKLIANHLNSIKIALPGYPISVQEFLQKPNASTAVEEFAREVDCSIVVLIGMKVLQDGSVQRDIGVININNQQLFDEVVRQLLSAKEPTLCLQQLQHQGFLNGKFYRQGNIKATRKHILPVVKKVLEQAERIESK